MESGLIHLISSLTQSRSEEFVEKVEEKTFSNSFNAIRVPFSLRLVRDNPTNPNLNCWANLDLCNLTALELLDAFIDK